MEIQSDVALENAPFFQENRCGCAAASSKYPIKIQSQLWGFLQTTRKGDLLLSPEEQGATKMQTEQSTSHPKEKLRSHSSSSIKPATLTKRAPYKILSVRVFQKPTSEGKLLETTKLLDPRTYGPEISSPTRVALKLACLTVIALSFPEWQPSCALVNGLLTRVIL